MNNTENILLLFLALLVGVSLVSQTGVNAQLRVALHSPIQAAFISFAVGTVILGVLAFSQGNPLFKPDAIQQIPWWAWLGGALGAFNIALSIFLAPKLGALALAIAIICGQVIASLIYDHHGWLGYPKIELTPHRILGALFIIAGVVLVSKK